MSAQEEPSARADEVMKATFPDVSGDSADQGDRLMMSLEAEAVQAALNAEAGADEGSADRYTYPLEDTEEVLSMEEAADGSNDPRHSGEQRPWQTAEESAVRVIGEDPEEPALTPEDETLLGIDPYFD